MARTTKAKALERLQRALDAISALKQCQTASPAFKKWRRDTEIAIVNTFDKEDRHIADFKRVDYGHGEWSPEITVEQQRDYWKGLDSATAVLDSMIDEVKEYWEDENEIPTLSETHENEPINTNEIFIVHGRDEGAKETVARFLETLDLKPLILHEQANLGRTIIEKFEQHAEVGFVVALLTPDDVGAGKGEESTLNPRARQNVIFEFGYFIGKLSRKRVCALVKGNVEKPSDYDGVLYISLDDSGGWKMKLFKELRSAGFDIDANKAV